jgi:hypothetical protein
MPNQNRTGPKGKGSKTGRKLGKCHTTETEQKQMVEQIVIHEKQPSAFIDYYTKLINYFHKRGKEKDIH